MNIIFKAEPGTEEDAFIFNEGSIDRGLFIIGLYNIIVNPFGAFFEIDVNSFIS